MINAHMTLMLHVEINWSCLLHSSRIGMNPLCFDRKAPMGQPGHVPTLRIYCKRQKLSERKVLLFSMNRESFPNKCQAQQWLFQTVEAKMQMFSLSEL